MCLAVPVGRAHHRVVIRLHTGHPHQGVEEGVEKDAVTGEVGAASGEVGEVHRVEEVVPILIAEGLGRDCQQQGLAKPGTPCSQKGMGTEVRVELRLIIRDSERTRVGGDTEHVSICDLKCYHIGNGELLPGDTWI